MLRRLAVPALAVPALALALAVALSGCFQFRTVLKLNADGSGTIEQSLYLASFVMSMMPSGDSTATLYEEDALRAQTDSFGTGVRFVEVVDAELPGYEGYRAVYAFDDVNTVRLPFDSDALDLDGDEASRDDIAPGDKEEAKDDDDPTDAVRFTATFDYDAAARTLVIRIPHADPGTREIHPDTLAARTDSLRRNMEQGMGMMRAFLSDARLSFTVETPAPITETDAQFADTTTVTLMDYELGMFVDQILAEPELAARLELAETEGERQAILLSLSERDGMRLEPAEEITVRFE